MGKQYSTSNQGMHRCKSYHLPLNVCTAYACYIRDTCIVQSFFMYLQCFQDHHQQVVSESRLCCCVIA